MESTKNFKNIDDYLEHWDNFFEEWKKDKKGTFNKDVIWKNRKGKGETELEYDVLPQPYLGNIQNHSVITLNLNPSRSKKIMAMKILRNYFKILNINIKNMQKVFQLMILIHFGKTRKIG